MSSTEEEKQFLSIFNFVGFVNFLKKNSVISLALAAVISNQLNKLTESFVDDLIMPIVNIDSDKDGVEDIKKLQEKELHIFNIKFKIGNFLFLILKFCIITYIIFLLSSVFTNLEWVEK
jgi:large-conductance mechanosensitive channel